MIIFESPKCHTNSRDIIDLKAPHVFDYCGEGSGSVSILFAPSSACLCVACSSGSASLWSGDSFSLRYGFLWLFFFLRVWGSGLDRTDDIRG